MTAPSTQPSSKSTSKWWYVGIIGFLFVPPFGFLVSILLLWFMPDKTRSTTWRERLKNWKTYWFRSGSTALALLVIIGGIFIYAISPTPEISILSSREHQGDAKDYTVNIEGTLVDKLTVNGKTVPKTGEKSYQHTIPFTDDSMRVEVIATGYGGKEARETFTIERDSVPTPTITVTSPTNLDEGKTDYPLTFTTENATKASVSGKPATGQNGEFTAPITLDSRSTSVEIVAQNEIKTTKETITITRPETVQEESERIAREHGEKVRAERALKQEKIEKIFSLYDGSHTGLKRFVKENLNNPGSFEHVETFYRDQGDFLLVTMKFRGENGFGAVRTNQVTAKVDFEGNVLDIVDFQE